MREVLRRNEPNWGKGGAAKRIPSGSELNLQNEANFTLNVNKMKSLMRESPANFTLAFERTRFGRMAS